MRSSVTARAILDAARRLAPEPVASVFDLRGGGNSRVFGVQATSGKRFVLKRYPESDLRGRRQAEASALAFMARRGLAGVPCLVATDPENHQSLITWVDGEPIESLSDADVRKFLDFQIKLDRSIDEPARVEIGEAAEACISGKRIVENIVLRLDRLRLVKEDTPGFADFFDRGLEPALSEFESRARKLYRDLGREFDAELPAKERTLIASDFGAHNALRQADGPLTFVDFEYFGWDDPSTSIANFVLHPGMRLTPGQRACYREGLISHFNEETLGVRYGALEPLYVLRWCTIILGELLPDKWSQRLESNPGLGDWDTVRRAQLRKAEALLSDFTPVSR